MDRALVSALVDRWRTETHTFHFPFGEMAITLEDVSMLLGLPIAGTPVYGGAVDVGWRQHILHRFHGVLPPGGTYDYDSFLVY